VPGDLARGKIRTGEIKMPAKSTAQVTLNTVTELSQLIVARAASWAPAAGYNRGSLAPYMEVAGLTRFLKGGGAGHHVKVNLHKLVDSIVPDGTGIMDLEVDNRGYDEVQAGYLANSLRERLYYSFNDQAALGALVEAEADPDAVDPATYLGRAYGAHEFVPPTFANDEVKTEAARLVAAVLAEAEKRRACDNVENLMRYIGFAEFLPAKTTEMVATVPGFGEIKFTVENDRRGLPRTDRTAVKIRQAMSEHLEQLISSGAIVPATAA
jgi:hypothetical protein